MEVKQDEIGQCYRIGRGKKIVCEFTRYGPGSLRDAVYEGRFSLMRTRNERGENGHQADQIYISEKLTPGAAEAFARLRDAKKRGVVHQVHTKNGFIFVRMIPHGRKIRVSNRIECERVLRGEQ